MRNNTEKLQILKELAIEHDVAVIASHILNHPHFPIWSGSSKPEQHHYGTGGLCEHTFEVVTTSLKIADQYNHKLTINRSVLFLAGLYHDCGKLWDYGYIKKDGSEMEFFSLPHKRKIHHISRSAIEFNKICDRITDYYYQYADDVTHCILAHHGKREYGSPVAPYTAEAWILHLSDSISARMDDFNKIDLVTYKQ